MAFGADDTAKALDEALKIKLDRFGAAARESNLHAVVYARPTSKPWTENAASFARKMAVGLAIIGAACGAGMAIKNAPEPAKPVAIESIAVPVQATEAATAVKEEAPAWKSAKFERLRQSLRYVEVTVGKQKHSVLDMASRITLVKAVSEEMKLSDNGLKWTDLYGIIHAETGWVARDGMGANKVKSSGLAQMEPDTAQAIGIKDPNDPIQAVWGAAYLMQEAAQWSHSKVQKAKRHLHMKKGAEESAFREGISIYYNTSTALRSSWNVRNTDEFPDATQAHIQNSRDGAMVAGAMEKKILASAKYFAGEAIKSESTAEKTPGDASVLKTVKMVSFLQESLDTKCEIKAKSDWFSSALKIHSTCKSMVDNEEVHGALGDLYVVGSINGVDVLINTGGSERNGALSITSNGNDSAVIFDQGMLETIQQSIHDPIAQKNAVLFIIGHEIGHTQAFKDAAARGESVEGLVTGTEHEIEADLYSATEFLPSKGFTPNESIESAKNAINAMHTYIEKNTSPFKQIYYKAAFTQRELNLEHELQNHINSMDNRMAMTEH
jgi:hypothetical protein